MRRGQLAHPREPLTFRTKATFGPAVTPGFPTVTTTRRASLFRRALVKRRGNLAPIGRPGASHFRRRPPRLPPRGGKLRLPARLRASHPGLPAGLGKWRIFTPCENNAYRKQLRFRLGTRVNIPIVGKTTYIDQKTTTVQYPTMPNYKGMRWFKCDLHVQTPREPHWREDASRLAPNASPEEKTASARSYLERCHEIGLEVIGVTDHNFAPRAQDSFIHILRQENNEVATSAFAGHRWPFYRALKLPLRVEQFPARTFLVCSIATLR